MGLKRTEGVTSLNVRLQLLKWWIIIHALRMMLEFDIHTNMPLCVAPNFFLCYALFFFPWKHCFFSPLLIKFFEENLLCSEMVPFQNVYNGKSLQLLNLGKNPIQIKWSKLHLKPNKCNRKITYQYLRLKIRKKSNKKWFRYTNNNQLK